MMCPQRSDKVPDSLAAIDGTLRRPARHMVSSNPTRQGGIHVRKAVSVVVAAMVIAGCSGTASTARPGTPASSASTAATAAPGTSTAAPPTAVGIPALRDGPVRAGTYSFLNGLGTFEVPAGWEACCDAFGVLKSDFAALLFEDITEVVVYADSCRWKAGPNLEPKGAQATAAAFAAQGGHQGTQPEATTVGGLPGWRVTLTVPADQAMTGRPEDGVFTGCDEAQFATWGLKNGDGDPSRWQQGPAQIDDLYIVDVGSRTVVIDMVTGPDIAASDQAELDAMLASVTFD
jgi:hypothetical protein